MRVGTAWLVIFAVNVLWAAAFFGYARRNTTPVVRGGEIVHSSQPANRMTSSPSLKPAVGTGAVQLAAAIATNQTRATGSVAKVPEMVSVPGGRQFGWQDVTNEAYKVYLSRLRQAGCPEKQIRNIVLADVAELFDKRRLDHAIKTDIPWWKSDHFMGTLPVQMMVSVNFDQERRQILDNLLGENWDKDVKLPALNGSAVNLTGPVLGALPAETWNSVQEVCSRSMERAQAYQMTRINEGKPIESAEMAKLRDYTRTELAKILSPEEVEEFLLRFSHNSSRLRQDMRGIDVTPDEFRKMFRAIDPIEHQTQLDYGGAEMLSQKQRDQLEAQRDRAIREALSADRFEQYRLTKDPLYRQAQMLATQYGMNARAIQPIYQLQKTLEAKRNEIAQSATLTPEQKAAALMSVAVEQQTGLQKMLGDASYR